MPVNIPSSSNIEDDINGYVETSELVNTFLFAASFMSELFSPVGIQDKNNCSCLKLVLLVYNP